MIPKPKAIFFDWDGTLADSFAFLEAAHGHTRQALGLAPFAEGEFAERYFGQPREKLYKELYAPHQEKARPIFETYVAENHMNLSPLEDAESILKAAAGLDLPMGVVSNKKGEFIRAEIAHFGWEQFFRSAVGAGEAEQDKPAAAPLLLAIKQAGLATDPAAVWYVGDTETDLACAANAGCVSVFLSHMPQDDVLIEKYRPDLVIKNCRDLCGFLLQNHGK